MSVERIHELAHEPEPPDEPEPVPTPDEPDGEPEPQDVAGEGETGDDPPPPPMGERDVDERLDKIAASAKRFRARIAEVLGEDANELYACPLCEPDIPGWIHPASIAAPRDAMQERLFEAMQPPTAPEYLPAKNVKRCEDCGGHGKVASGSLVPSKETVTCADCKGYGYTPPPGASVPTAGNGHAPTGELEPPPAPLSTDDRDIWGRDRLLPDGRENPNFGKAPQYADPAYP